MIEKTAVVNSENGFHTRPAAVFVKKAKEFTSKITVSFGDKEASAKSLFKLQTLGIVQGSEIQIKADGEDAQDAANSLAELLETLD